MRNWCSGVVTAILAVTTGMWLAIPLIDSMRAGTRQQATVEAQAMTVFLTAGLVLLAVCRWIDDGRRVWRVGLLVCLVVVNSLVRVTMSPRVFGVVVDDLPCPPQVAQVFPGCHVVRATDLTLVPGADAVAEGGWAHAQLV